MYTAITYICISCVLAIIGLRLHSIKKKNKKISPTLNYLFYSVIFFLSGELISIASIFTYYIYKQPRILLIGDATCRFLAFIASAYILQLLLFKVAPKSKFRIIPSILVGFFGLYTYLYTLSINYTPFIKEGLVHWQIPDNLVRLTGVVFLMIWIPTAVFFLRAFEKTKYTVLSLGIIGFGFLIAAIGSITEGFARSTVEFILADFIQGMGFILLFLGLLSDEKKDQNIELA